MQRLLRGWWLYLGLGLLVVVLHVQWTRMGVPSAKPLEVPEPTHAARAQGWWPQEIQPSTMKETLRRRPGLAFALSVVSAVVAIMVIGGLLLGIWEFCNGAMRSIWTFPSRRPPAWSLGEFVRITLLAILMAGLLPFIRMGVMTVYPSAHLDFHFWLTSSMLFLDAFLVVVILTFARGKATRTNAWSLVAGSTRHPWRAIREGFRAYATVFPWLFLLLYAIVEGARLFGYEPPMEPIQELVFQEGRPGVLALTVVLACVLGPLAEECFFRGVFYAALRQRTSRVVAMLISGSLFALVHSNLVGFLPIMLLGCLLAYLYERTGTLVSPLAVHITHNTLLMAFGMTMRQLMTPN